MPSPTQDNKPTSPRETLSVFASRMMASDTASGLTTEQKFDEALAAIAAYYKGLIPPKIDMKHATSSGSPAGWGIVTGHNDCVDTIQRNFTGDTHE